MSGVHYKYCICVDCCNEKKTQDIDEIHEHLLIRDFMSGYTCWTEHGEHKAISNSHSHLATPLTMVDLFAL
jgi:hypothetical protein